MCRLNRGGVSLSPFDERFDYENAKLKLNSNLKLKFNIDARNAIAFVA